MIKDNFHQPPLVEKLRNWQSSNITDSYHNIQRFWHNSIELWLQSFISKKAQKRRSLLEALDLPSLDFFQLLQLFQTICDCNTCLAKRQKIFRAANFRVLLGPKTMEEGWKSKIVVPLVMHNIFCYIVIFHLSVLATTNVVLMISVDFCVWDMIVFFDFRLIQPGNVAPKLPPSPSGLTGKPSCTASWRQSTKAYRTKSNT